MLLSSITSPVSHEGYLHPRIDALLRAWQQPVAAAFQVPGKGVLVHSGGPIPSGARLIAFRDSQGVVRVIQ